MQWCSVTLSVNLNTNQPQYETKPIYGFSTCHVVHVLAVAKCRWARRAEQLWREANSDDKTTRLTKIRSLRQWNWKHRDKVSQINYRRYTECVIRQLPTVVLGCLLILEDLVKCPFSETLMKCIRRLSQPFFGKL